MRQTAARRRHSAFAAGLASLVMAAGLATAPAQAADKTKYIALGDSFAAGQGAGPYLDDCYRSLNTYSALADADKAINLVVNAACSGATTDGVLNTQMAELNKSTDLVTITAGGNNIGFGNIITSCGVALGGATPGEACDLAIGSALAQFGPLPGSGPLHEDVLSMIQRVRKAAPNAKIVVTGYPYLLNPVPPGGTDPASIFIDRATQLSDALNETIAFAAATANAAASDDPAVQYVDVREIFKDHGVNSGAPWINLDLTNPASPDNFHPNAAGYQAYFTELSEAGVYGGN
ncbi:SGNH/GDSL hydrolase family protein [Pseudarthrobacter phenanthrenivorans]|uniref:SGNH/GDSL hydrolase family protein n=1 Tax=Pseudarthrobacter phenanthrenivorans TaxID=361575 RepID=UPI0015E86617|nr:SGNH/GDSL hydrolase family protein [Pseudarthrobacter phenanthrenivorans]